MYPYVEVEFLTNGGGANNSDECEADIVPHTWMVSQTQSYWPPFQKNESVMKAQINGASPDPATWPTYSIQVVCAAGRV